MLGCGRAHVLSVENFVVERQRLKWLVLSVVAQAHIQVVILVWKIPVEHSLYPRIDQYGTQERTLPYVLPSCASPDMSRIALRPPGVSVDSDALQEL